MGGWAVGKRSESLHRGYKKRGWRLKGGHTNDLKIQFCSVLEHDDEVRSVIYGYFLLTCVQTWHSTIWHSVWILFVWRMLYINRNSVKSWRPSWGVACSWELSMSPDNLVSMVAGANELKQVLFFLSHSYFCLWHRLTNTRCFCRVQICTYVFKNYEPYVICFFCWFVHNNIIIWLVILELIRFT